MDLKTIKGLAKRYGIDNDRISSLENTRQYMVSHAPDQCAGQECCLHNRSDHCMRGFPQSFRYDRGIMERTCPHGVGHPDPDQKTFFEIAFGDQAKYEWIHGCDGCCDPDSPIYQQNYGSDIITA